jgi:hypothetical protein
MPITRPRRRAAALSILAVSSLAGLALVSGSGTAEAHNYRQSIEVGVFGDMPYGDYGRAHYPAVLAEMNRSDLDFSVFVGDTKNGSEPCYADPHPSDPANATPENAVANAKHPDVYKSARAAFNSLSQPVVYVPGDNEWTDCDRTSVEDGHVADSSDRLAYLRSLSYPTDRTLGRHTMRVVRQSKAYPENVRWEQGSVTFIALNVPGSDNNFSLGGKEGPAAESQAEYAARNTANLEWLRKGFAEAKTNHSRGVAVFLQADMWDPSATQTHFADTKKELFKQTTAFKGQVLLVDGDSHHFVVDKPLTDYASTNAAGLEGPNTVENFTRTTGFGEDQNHWTSITVDQRDPNLFSVHQHIVAANVPSVTPPAG